MNYWILCVKFMKNKLMEAEAKSIHCFMLELLSSVCCFPISQISSLYLMMCAYDKMLCYVIAVR